MVVRLTPSLAESSFLVSIPASSNGFLRLLSLAEKRSHWTLAVSKASPAPMPQSALVENAGDLGIGVLVQQSVDLPVHRFVSGSQLLSRQVTRQGQRRGGAAAKTYGRSDLALFGQGDVLDQECEHALALRGFGMGMPLRRILWCTFMRLPHKPQTTRPCLQGGAFSWRAGVAFEADCFGGCTQPLSVAFVLLPRMGSHLSYVVFGLGAATPGAAKRLK